MPCSGRCTFGPKMVVPWALCLFNVVRYLKECVLFFFSFFVLGCRMIQGAKHQNFQDKQDIDTGPNREHDCVKWTTKLWLLFQGAFWLSLVMVFLNFTLMIQTGNVLKKVMTESYMKTHVLVSKYSQFVTSGSSICTGTSTTYFHVGMELLGGTFYFCPGWHGTWSTPIIASQMPQTITYGDLG